VQAEYGGGDVKRSITEVIASNGGVTFDELIDAIEDSGAGSQVDGLKDTLEMMTYIRDLMPNFSAPSLFALMSSLMEMRFRHRIIGQLTAMNTNLRYMGLGIAPQSSDTTQDDEEAFWGEVFTDADILPWLTSGVAALAEPSPVGETVMAGRMAEIVGGRVFSSIGSWLWGLFSDDPSSVPEGSIVGMLEKIANAAGGGSNSNTLTIQTIVNNINDAIGDDDIEDYPYVYSVLQSVMDFLPDEFQSDYSVSDASSIVQMAMIDRTLSTIASKLDSIEALRCICEELAKILSVVDRQQVAVVTDLQGESTYKCAAAKWFIAKVNEYFSVVTEQVEKHEDDIQQDDFWSSVSGVYEIFKGDMIRVNDALLGFFGADIVEEITTARVEDTKSVEGVVFEVSDGWINDIYTASTPNGAVSAMMTRVGNVIPLVSAEKKQSIEYFLRNSRGLERVFLDEESPLAVSGDEILAYSGWSLAECGFDFSCMPRGGTWNYGTPVLIPGSAGSGVWNLSGYPVGNWVQVTSERDEDNERIAFLTDDDYTVELKIDTVPATADVRVRLADCANDIIMDTYYSASTSVIYRGSVANVLIQTTEGNNPDDIVVSIRRVG
jgi:hypothetical protein